MIIKNKYCTVKHSSGEIHVNEYCENVRIETAQTMNVYDSIDVVPEGDVLPMPEEGEPVEENKLYKFNNKVYHVVQPHIRTYYDPDETPALFAVHRTEKDKSKKADNKKCKAD